MSGAYIKTCIPWEPNRLLGRAMTRIIEEENGWVLIRDYDTMLLNTSWYAICQNAIEKVGHDAGIITCYTNAIGSSVQHLKCLSDNIKDHVNVANGRKLNHKGIITDITAKAKYSKVSGVFMLMHTDTLKKICPLPEKFLGLDNWINDRVIEAGLKIYRTEDLYIYHLYGRDWKCGK